MLPVLESSCPKDNNANLTDGSKYLGIAGGIIEPAKIKIQHKSNVFPIPNELVSLLAINEPINAPTLPIPKINPSERADIPKKLTK